MTDHVACWLLRQRRAATHEEFMVNKGVTKEQARLNHVIMVDVVKHRECQIIEVSAIEG